MNKIARLLKETAKEPKKIEELYFLLAGSKVAFLFYRHPETKESRLIYLNMVPEATEEPGTGNGSAHEYVPFFASAPLAASAVRRIDADGLKVNCGEAQAAQFLKAAQALGRPCLMNPFSRYSRKLSAEEMDKIIQIAAQFDRMRSPTQLPPLDDPESEAFYQKIERYKKANSTPRTMAELIDMAAACLDSRLAFHPRVKEGLPAWPEADSVEIGDIVWRMFVALSSSLYQMAVKKDISENKFLKENGMALVMVEAPPPGDEIFEKYRRDQYLGREITFYSYIFSPAYFDISLHFHLLPDDRVLVCHLGRTLPSGSNQEKAIKS
jgi:hypothetical protein